MGLKKICKPQMLSRIRYMNSFNFCNLSAPEVKDENKNTDVEAKNIYKTKMSYFIPSHAVKKIDNVETITGVYVGRCFISWATINIPRITLLEWCVKPFSDQFLKKNNEFTTLQQAYKIRNALPLSDLYVMETFSIRGKEYFNKLIYINLYSMLIVLLNGINSDEMDTKVIFQKQQLVNKLHDLLLQNERISSSPLVENMLIKCLKSESTGHESRAPNIYTDLEIDLKYLDLLRSATIASKEDLSLVFLLITTFTDLYIFNNQESWDKILKKTPRMRIV